MDSIEALLRLLHIPGLGAAKVRRLIQTYGSPTEAFLAEGPELARLPYWEGRKKLNGWEEDLRMVERHGVQLVPFYAKNYPSHLLDIADHPILLYVRGNLLPIDSQAIAVIGTRFSTPYGMDTARSFCRALSQSGAPIISGLARGIDTAAHESALPGRTLAVIGSGLGNLYPPENRALADAIAEGGAVISEFSMMTPPDRQTFPQRNRIVSGMSRAVLLIEAPKKSGAMITMEIAERQGRVCWAVPGRIDFPSFEGNHWLIQQGKAKLAMRPGDLLEGCFDLFGGVLPKQAKVDLFGEEKKFFDAMPPGCFSLDELCVLTRQPVAKISVLLMSLVLKNIIKEMPGKRYQKR